MNEFVCTSPIDGREITRQPKISDAAIIKAIEQAALAQHHWRALPLSERIDACLRLVVRVMAHKDACAQELTEQMGRPIAHAPAELDGFAARARSLCAQAESALATRTPLSAPGARRFIRREALGTVMILAPWNYPWLTTVNTLIPALLAGNSVLLKPSTQTPLVGERLRQAAREAELPDGVLQVVPLAHQQTRHVLEYADVQGVFFTGSVAGGAAIENALVGRFMPLGLELGGCDAAYVRSDADLEQAVSSIVDGAFYNAGQSCCGLQRIYVHARHYDEFCERAAALTRAYRLGDPRDPETTLGPLAKMAAAEQLRRVAAQACAGGARDLVSPAQFTHDASAQYCAPRLLAGAHHGLSLMREECFAPIAGVMRVGSDAEALSLINDSVYGLTAALYSRDSEASLQLAERLDVGTVYLNRCDVLDAELPWTGLKHSGRGSSLSALGFDAVTRAKAFNFRLSE